MTSITDGTPAPARPGPSLRELAGWRPMWASLAISVMWLVVLFDAMFGPDIVSSSGGPSGSTTTLPSSVVVALFALLATIPVARHGLRDERAEP
jgi:hypothetical protein